MKIEGTERSISRWEDAITTADTPSLTHRLSKRIIKGDEFLGFTPEIEFLYLTKIEGVDLFTTPYEKDDGIMTASHKIRTFNTNLTLSYKFSDWNTLYTVAGYYNQDGSNWMEFTLGGSIKFSNSSKVLK